MRSPLVGSSKAYEDYYCSQAGHGLPVFIGRRHMRGRGLGSLLGGIGRSLIPLLKSGGKALLKEGARTGMQVAQNVLAGQNIKSAMKQGARQGGKRLLHGAIGHVTGSAPPGEPSTRRIKHTAPKRRTKKARRSGVARDIFD